MRTKLVRSLKSLAVGVIVFGVALSAFAQAGHREFSFLNVLSITLTNTKQYTNISSPNLAGVTTNVVGLIWTNNFGNQVVAAAGDSTALTVDVPLWADRDGRIPLVFIAPTNQAYGSGFMSGAELNIHFLSGGSGANAAVNFTFVPVPDGVHESTISGDQWTVGVTAVTTSEVDVCTNVPLYKWPGVKTLRLKTAVDTDTDASSQVVVDSITLNGFVP